jgi:DHA1 family bicyclomycin/chloramphenicol resistance-like MFS transporter
MQPGFTRSAIVLGLLACVGPVAIDMYLPAMPVIAQGLNTDIASVQMTLSLYFVAFGVAQLAYGPLADMYGRKPPLYAGLLLFLLGSVGCTLAPSIEWLIFSRFVQGIGGAAVMVVPRAIIRDLHTGPQATRLMAMVMLVISVSPMLAPLAGSALIALFEWRSIFVAMIVMAVLSIVLTALMQPETLAAKDRVPVNLPNLARGSLDLFRDPYFMGLTFIGGFGMASFFVFIASATFVYTSHYGLTPTQFSLAFAANAIGFFAASQLAAGLGERFGAKRVMLRASLGFAAFAVALLMFALVAPVSLFFLMAMLFLANACLGLIIPTAMVMALDDHGDRAGLASSLGGTLQMVAGAFMIAVTGPFFDGTPLPMIAAIALCAVIALVLAVLVLGRPVSARPSIAE